MPAAATIVIERRSPRDIKIRELYIRVEGRPEQTLRYGQEIALDVPPGRYRVQATNRLFSRSVWVQVEAGQTAELRAANVATKGLLALVMIIGGGLAYRVTLERVAPQPDNRTSRA